MVLPAVAQTVGETASAQEKWPQASLRAEASAQIAQDTVNITLATEVSGVSQAAVAKLLNTTLESVMKQAKGNTKVKATSGNYRVWPMSNEKGQISDWRGRAEIMLESEDFAAASELASQFTDRMPISNLAFSVSPQARAKQEEALLSEAAQAFRSRALAVTNAFGFASYSIRNMDIGGSGAQFQPQPRFMAMAADKSSVPIEGGTEWVTVSIQGSIFLYSTKK
ncbi:MAG TPA: SIMPL domain-containing protein [Candidimonas sp.]|nr:SIMPL domain-containing protein [Candidimonas sp.]